MGKKVKCKYIFADDYNPVCVNGAYGGVNPQGEIVINFYFERAALPYSQTYEVKGNELTEVEAEREPRDISDSFVRFVSTGIILDYRHAKNIYEWLGENIKKLESHKNAIPTKK